MNETIPTAERQEDIKSHIIEVAKKAFHKQGIKNVTMDDISHKLSMSKRTLYQLFADKEDLLLACVKEEEKRTHQLMSDFAKKANNVLDLLLKNFAFRLKILETASPQFINDLSKFPRVVAYLDERREAHRKLVVDFLQKGVEQGYFQEGLNFDIIYNIVSSPIDLVTGQMFSRSTPTEIFLNYVFVYFRGCATPKGTAMMDEFLKEYKQKGTAL